MTCSRYRLWPDKRDCDVICKSRYDRQVRLQKDLTKKLYHEKQTEFRYRMNIIYVSINIINLQFKLSKTQGTTGKLKFNILLAMLNVKDTHCVNVKLHFL